MVLLCVFIFKLNFVIELGEERKEKRMGARKEKVECRKDQKEVILSILIG